jgi:4-aminobutyrate aminotransferase-like enzyme
LRSAKFKIGDVRGRGLLNALEFRDVKDGTANKVAEACLKRGLMYVHRFLVSCGA